MLKLPRSAQGNTWWGMEYYNLCYL